MVISENNNIKIKIVKLYNHTALRMLTPEKIPWLVTSLVQTNIPSLLSLSIATL